MAGHEKAACPGEGSAASDIQHAHYTKSEPAASTGLPVAFTVFKSSTPLSKAFRLAGDGQVEKTAAAQMTSGTAQRIELGFEKFGSFLDRLTVEQATGYGTHNPAQFGTKTRIVTEAKAEPPKTIARTKSFFQYRNEPGILMLDHDSSPYGRAITADELRKILAGIIPGFNGFAGLVRGSVSSGVHRIGELPKEVTACHIYVPVPDTSDIPRCGAALVKRLWLAGHGFIALSRSGAMLERTLIDGSVFAGERLDFTGWPVIVSDDLEYTPPTAEYHAGGYLDTTVLPDLNESEAAEYQRLVADAKAAIRPEADKIKAAWIDARVSELVKAGSPEPEAREQLERLAQGGTQDLPAGFNLHFADHGTVTVADVLADPKKFDMQALADPIESVEYGRTTAKFYANAGKGQAKPCINSFAHGMEGRFFLHNKNPTLPTLPTTARAASYTEPDSSYTKQAESYTKPGFLTFTAEDGKVKRIIESKAASILAQKLKGKFALNAKALEWHKFVNTHWQTAPKSETEKVIVDLLEEGIQPLGFTSGYLTGTLNILQKADKLPLPAPARGKIPFANGLLDIKKGRLEPATPDNALTWAIPHRHNPRSDCPRFTAWLSDALGSDKALIHLLVAFINACLMGRSDLHIFVYLLGPGGTGKSTFIRLLTAMLGDSNCVSTDLKNLATNRFETATLYGKRLAVISDAGRYSGSVDVLKAMTGQDALRNEKKHMQQCGTFTYDGMVVIASNEQLAATDYTSGLERRRIVVEFERRFTAIEKAEFQAQGGEASLHEEIPAIINLALAMGRDEVTKIFAHPPAACKASNREALRSQNPVADWICENLAPAPGNWVTIGLKKELRPSGGGVEFEDTDLKLYPNYLRWCKENGRESLSLEKPGSARPRSHRSGASHIDKTTK